MAESQLGRRKAEVAQLYMRNLEVLSQWNEASGKIFNEEYPTAGYQQITQIAHAVHGNIRYE